MCPVAHVEAGLRSFDRGMPEEINRVLTDQVADVLYTTERTAQDNLLREGIAAERIVFVGNVMIDSLLANRATAVAPQETLRRGGCDPALLGDPPRYGVVTLHRPRTSTTGRRWSLCSCCCGTSRRDCRW